MKLYYSPGACSLAPHIVAREAGLPIDLVKVDLRAKRTEDGRNYLEINPKGSVPMLQLEDGARLTENAVVLQYLADHAPDAELIPAPGTMDRWRLLETLNFIATELHKGFGPLWNPATPAEGREAAVAQLGKKFDLLEQQVAADDGYLNGERFGITDAYFFAVFNWTRVHHIDTAAWPKLRALHRRIGERPATVEAMRAEGLIG
jgi:glutathione S-transferase